MSTVALTAAHAPAYRTLMLEAYTLAADAFTSTAEERGAEPLAWWERRIAAPDGRSRSFGAFLEGELVGTVALEFEAKAKKRHSALVIGMYVRPSARGRGLGTELLSAAVEAARATPGVERLRLTVTEGNAPALRLYRALGFRTWGVEPDAIRTPDGLKGKVHMAMPLGTGVERSHGPADADPDAAERGHRARATPARQADVSAAPLEGGCTCGDVRYRLASAPLFVHCCHCRWCQRESGAAFALNAMVESDRLTVLGGEPEPVPTPSDSGAGQTIVRCRVCRVALWSHYAGSGPAVSFVRVGTLDAPDRLPPDVHIFTASRQPWVVIPDGAPAFEAFYDREALWPPESLARRQALLPAIHAHRESLRT